MILNFEFNIVKTTILPTIMPLLTNEDLMVNIVNMALDITKNKDYLSKVDYNNLVWRYLKLGSDVREMPAQALYSIVNCLPDYPNYVVNEEIQCRYLYTPSICL